MRLDEPEHDAAIRVDVVAVHEHQAAVLSNAGRRQPRRVLRVVVHHAHPLEERRADHAAQFVGRVRPVGARAVDDDHIVQRNVPQFLEDPRQQTVGWQRAGDVGDHDGETLARRHDLGERPRTQGPPNRGLERRALIGQALDEPRLEDGDRTRQVDVEPVAAVLQVDAHLQILLPPVFKAS